MMVNKEEGIERLNEVKQRCDLFNDLYKQELQRLSSGTPTHEEMRAALKKLAAYVNEYVAASNEYIAVKNYYGL